MHYYHWASFKAFAGQSAKELVFFIPLEKRSKLKKLKPRDLVHVVDYRSTFKGKGVWFLLMGTILTLKQVLISVKHPFTHPHVFNTSSSAGIHFSLTLRSPHSSLSSPSCGEDTRRRVQFSSGTTLRDWTHPMLTDFSEGACPDLRTLG